MEKIGFYRKVFITTLLTALFFASCTTSIQDVKDNIDKYEGKEVTVSGEVVETTNILVKKYYKIKDESGEINIITKESLPEKNTQVTVTGTVEKMLKIGDLEMLAIKEKERK